MGAWGVGVFQNDTAIDITHDAAKATQEWLRIPECVEDIDGTLAAVRIHHTLARDCHGPCLNPVELQEIRDGVLELHDAKFAELTLDPEQFRQRRAVIAEVFRDYLLFLEKDRPATGP